MAKIAFTAYMGRGIATKDWIGKPVTIGQPGPTIGKVTGVSDDGDSIIFEVDDYDGAFHPDRKNPDVSLSVGE